MRVLFSLLLNPPVLQQPVIVCDTDPRLQGPGTDHILILMTLEYAVLARNIEGHRNFRVVNWEAFGEELAKQLCCIPGPCALLMDAQFQKAVVNLTGTIQATIEAVVPASRHAQHSCHWWNDNLSCLKKEMNQLGSLLYRYRAIPDHPSHNLYHRTRCSYGDEILSGPRSNIGQTSWSQ